jgi:hypothetical protein
MEGGNDRVHTNDGPGSSGSIERSEGVGKPIGAHGFHRLSHAGCSAEAGRIGFSRTLDPIAGFNGLHHAHGLASLLEANSERSRYQRFPHAGIGPRDEYART